MTDASITINGEMVYIPEFDTYDFEEINLWFEPRM
jgi:hypothetical protein